MTKKDTPNSGPDLAHDGDQADQEEAAAAQPATGNHVLVLADGRSVRSDFAGATHHDGLPVVSVYESVQ
ncbi:hypothetical protein [Planomonospora sp. ID82291]|uniref:hypothetical protein n=1 Tax=Planomonospora sp. ID82291 TaxID=2738136 RepID=UPI0018C38F95|nr:hypothetical protein [Planomonospora sp. ID82291]MBG0819141.1 hypothetical protein [Planomonospora sp. ID82291]